VPTEEPIVQAACTLAESARSLARVILFGSWARGEAGPDGDLDFLVVEREVASKVDEMVGSGLLYLRSGYRSTSWSSLRSRRAPQRAQKIRDLADH
jgi:Nucleotidyltransferase domain